MHAANLGKELVVKVQYLRTRAAADMVYKEAAMLQRLEGARVRVPSLGQVIWTHEWAYMAMTCARLPNPRRLWHAWRHRSQHHAVFKSPFCPTSAAVY